MRNEVELICVGNELLNGHTLNTNAHWLAGEIINIGGRLTRIVTIPDELRIIATAVREAVGRNPRFVLTIGGLGPTFDDKTLSGIAEALGRKLKLNNQALKMVAAHYRSLVSKANTPMTSARLKMATIPEKAVPIPNPVGTAPAVKVRTRQTEIIALPGVPSEMKAIFSKHVRYLISKRMGRGAFVQFSFVVMGVMESDLAPIIDGVMARHPRIYVKSHPKGRESSGRSRIELHFSVASRSRTAAKRVISAAVEETLDLLATHRSRPREALADTTAKVTAARYPGSRSPITI